MKRLVAIFLAVLMVAAVMAACGGSKPAETTAAPAPAATEAAAAAAEAAAETKAAAETPAKGSIQIKYSTWAGDGEAAYEGMKKFKEYIEAEMKHNKMLADRVSQVLIRMEKHAGSKNGKIQEKEKIMKETML